MFETHSLSNLSRQDQYAELHRQMTALLAGETNPIANAGNFSALVMASLSGLNWCGFYFFDGKELVLGPFQGKPACLRIPLNRGVCGAAASRRETQLVADVHEFPGHIACDAASRSEIVVPLIKDGALIGVWDVDSPELNRFGEADQQGMEALCQVYLASLTAATPLPIYLSR